VAAAAPDPLQQRRPLVLGDDPLDLEEQLVFRRLAAGAVEEHHLYPGALQLVEEQHLVRVAPGESVGRVDVQPLETARGGDVPQPLERGPDQARAAEAVVDEHEVVEQPQPIGGHALAEGGDLAGDGLGLVLRRDARVHRGPHLAPLAPLAHRVLPPSPRRGSVWVVSATGSRWGARRRRSGTTCS
jgi:hypothetical protein